jgi:conjugal transfer pilus assembly protein TraD
MYMKNDQNKSQGADLISPIAEIFFEICKNLAKIGFDLGKLGFNHYFKRQNPVSKVEHKKLLVTKTTINPASIGLDTKTKKDVLLSSVDFSKHSLIVGATGFGKTNLIYNLQENYLKKGQPIIFFDPKGDLEAMTDFKNLCERYDMNCHIFSETCKSSVSLNPVLEGSITQVVNRIMCAFEWSEPFYHDASMSVLRLALEELEQDEIPFSLMAIYNVLKEKHESKNTQGLIVKLENIVKSDFGSILGGQGDDDYTLSKIRSERSCLYIGLSTQGYGETAMALGKIFLGELLYHSYKTLSTSVDSSINKKNPIAVFFDEFGALVTPQFIELENKCRGAGIDLTMAIQTISDLNVVDPELTIQIMENCANWFILKQRHPSSSETLSHSIGTVLTQKSTDQVEDGEKSGRGTTRDVHELIVHPDIIKYLNVGQCIILRQHPHCINLVNIRSHQKH